MKLSEIKKLKEARADERELVLKKFDGLEGTDTELVEPFDVLIQYEFEEGGYSDHPYGEGSAREQHGNSCAVIKVTADEEVQITDADDKPIKTLPKGTDVEDIPGYTKDLDKYFQRAAEQDCEE